MARWRCSIVRKPAQLGRVQDSGYHQLVLLAGVVLVLEVNSLLEGEDAVGDAGECATLQQIVDPSYQQNSHGPPVLLVVHLPCVLQGGDGGARDGVPVYVDLIRGAEDTRLPGSVKLVKLAVC